MDHIEDINIIKRVKNGDSDAFSQLVHKYQTPIYNLMLRMSGSRDSAFDLSQDAFVRAYEKLSQFSTEKIFFSWLYTISMNIARDYLRKNKKKDTLTRSMEYSGYERDSNAYEQGNNPHDQMMDRYQIDNALLFLPMDIREALVMRYKEEFSFKEVASALKISLSSAKMKVYRGLDSLRTIMSEE